MIKKYRKRPLIIEAVKVQGPFAADEIIKWSEGAVNWTHRHPDGGKYYPLIINTLEGVMEANIGDWIIRGTSGEFYPCKADVFADVYELAP